MPWLASSPGGDVPPALRRGLGVAVETVERPALTAGADGRIRPVATALAALSRARQPGSGLDRLSATLDRLEPDVVVNVCETLMGLHTVLRVTDVPVVAVGRPFVAALPGCPSLPGQPVQRAATALQTGVAGAGAARRLALSFYDAPDRGDVRVVPPLLRDPLFGLADVPCDGSVLVHLADPAMARPLVAWSDRNPGVRVHAFAAAEPHDHSPSLTFHGLSGRAFLERMAAARGVVCAARFETVSEAMWLGTPAVVVPMPGHYAQRCDAADAQAAGAGVASGTLDLDPFVDRLDQPRPDPTPFRRWVSRAESRAVGPIEEAAGVVLVGGDGAGDGRAEAGDVTVRPARAGL